MTQIFGIIAGLLVCFSFVIYIIDILRGRTKPQRSSWIIWVVVDLTAFTSQWNSGAKWSLLMPLVRTFLALVVFLLSIKYGHDRYKRYDVYVLLFLALAIGIWLKTGNSWLGLGAIIMIDGVGTLLTVLKTYHHPQTELKSAWVIDCLSGVFALLAVGGFRLSLLVYPAYVILANYSVIVAIDMGRMHAARQRRRKRSQLRKALA